MKVRRERCYPRAIIQREQIRELPPRTGAVAARRIERERWSPRCESVQYGGVAVDDLDDFAAAVVVAAFGAEGG